MILTATEAQEQIALVQYAGIQSLKDPLKENLKLIDVMFHIPNGELRHPVVAKRLKLMGVKAGVPDFFIMYPQEPYHGMFLELKSRNKWAKPSSNQLKFSLLAKKFGYWYYIAYGWEQAREAILEYIGISNVHTNQFQSSKYEDLI